MSKAQAIQEAESQIQSTANYEFDLLIANLKVLDRISRNKEWMRVNLS